MCGAFGALDTRHRQLGLETQETISKIALSVSYVMTIYIILLLGTQSLAERTLGLVGWVLPFVELYESVPKGAALG